VRGWKGSGGFVTPPAGGGGGRRRRGSACPPAGGHGECPTPALLEGKWGERGGVLPVTPPPWGACRPESAGATQGIRAELTQPNRCSTPAGQNVEECVFDAEGQKNGRTNGCRSRPTDRQRGDTEPLPSAPIDGHGAEAVERRCRARQYTVADLIVTLGAAVDGGSGGGEWWWGKGCG